MAMTPKAQATRIKIDRWDDIKKASAQKRKQSTE